MDVEFRGGPTLDAAVPRSFDGLAFEPSDPALPSAPRRMSNRTHGPLAPRLARGSNRRARGALRRGSLAGKTPAARRRHTPRGQDRGRPRVGRLPQPSTPTTHLRPHRRAPARRAARGRGGSTRLPGRHRPRPEGGGVANPDRRARADHRAQPLLSGPSRQRGRPGLLPHARLRVGGERGPVLDRRSGRGPRRRRPRGRGSCHRAVQRHAQAQHREPSPTRTVGSPASSRSRCRRTTSRPSTARCPPRPTTA